MNPNFIRFRGHGLGRNLQRRPREIAGSMDLIHQPGVQYFQSIEKKSLLYCYVYLRRHQLSLRAFAWFTCIVVMLGDGTGRK